MQDTAKTLDDNLETPVEDSVEITGTFLGSRDHKADHVIGLKIGFNETPYSVTGVAMGFVNGPKYVTGLMVGAGNLVTERFNGVQVGFICVATEGSYLQLGLLTLREHIPKHEPWYKRFSPIIGWNYGD